MITLQRLLEQNIGFFFPGNQQGIQQIVAAAKVPIEPTSRDVKFLGTYAPPIVAGTRPRS